MRCPGLGLTALIALCGPASLGQNSHEARTSVPPIPGEDILQPCEYRLALPETTLPIRAIWAIFDRGLDYLKWYEDRQVRAFATEHQLALVLAMHCRSKGREDMNVEPTKGIGRALFSAFDQFAAAEHRPELRTAPLIAMGWSGAGSLVGRLAGYRPERYLAGIAYAPGQYEPLGMNTIGLSKSAARSAQLISANGADNINGTERPYAYFRKYFNQGAPWTFVVQNRTPHCCLQNAQILILDWLNGVLATPRTSWGTGKHGYLSVTYSRVNDECKRPVFNATSARVSENIESPRDGELSAGWLPSATFAEGWLAFVRRPGPVAVWKP